MVKGEDQIKRRIFFTLKIDEIDITYFSELEAEATHWPFSTMSLHEN